MQAELPGTPRGAYFSIMSVLLLILSLIAFGDNLVTDVGQSSNRDPKFVVHGLFGLAWALLLATQANLVRVRNLRLHRRLGMAAFIVAIGVTLSTLYVFIVVWKGWAHMAPESRANRLLLPAFALCLLMAWQRRGQADWHKRLIFVASFFMLGPVLARVYDPLVASWAKPMLGALYTEQVDEAAFQLFFWGGWIGAFLSLALHDLGTRRRAHIVTATGFGWLALAWLIAALS